MYFCPKDLKVRYGTCHLEVCLEYLQIGNFGLHPLMHHHANVTKSSGYAQATID